MRGENSFGEKFVVVGPEGRSASGHQLYRIRFNSGATALYKKAVIDKGQVRDPERIGCGPVGKTWSRKEQRRESWFIRTKNRWRHMILRCYDPANPSFPRYGARSVRVCEEWHRLEQFVDDLPGLAGFEGWLQDPTWELDKDILGTGLLYGPQYCCFVSKVRNIQERHNSERQAAAYLIDGHVFQTFDDAGEFFGTRGENCRRWFHKQRASDTHTVASVLKPWPPTS